MTFTHALLYGTASGLAAMVLWCTSPFVLGYGWTVVADVPAAALLAAGWRSYGHALRDGRLSRWRAAALWLGMALVVKFTVLLVLPLYGLAWLWRMVRVVTAAEPHSGPATLEATAQADAALKRIHGTPAISYVAGRWQRGAPWYSYLYGLACKTPEGTLVLLVPAVACGLWGRLRFRQDAWAVLPALWLLAVLAAGRGTTMHLRYVIPLLPFLYLWGSRVLAAGRAWR
ncbi:MAG: hypothetical protein K6T86_10765 [Pirellulales bacterium]|nr:hypothetical protein [Pirellulales bacterium]